MSKKVFEGFVEKRLYAKGSKSEHNAVCVVLDDGSPYKLRRPHSAKANPFHDLALDVLVGKRYSIQGEMLAGSQILMSSWTEIPSPPSPITSRKP